MARFGSQAWLDEASRILRRGRLEGLDASVQSIVTGGPDGDVVSTWRFEAGRLATAIEGKAADSDAMLTVTFADAVAMMRGELPASVAFMQGRLKVSGDMGTVMQLLEASERPAAAEAREALAAATDQLTG